MKSYQKPIKYRQRKYLKYIETHDCLACDGSCNGDIVAHHESMLAEKGTSTKPNDSETVPLCDHHHKLRELEGKITFWSKIYSSSTSISDELDVAIINECLLKEMVKYLTDYLRRKP